MTKTRDELKAAVAERIEQHKETFIRLVKDILHDPETGFREFSTSRRVQRRLEEFGIAHQAGIALTGIKGVLKGAAPGPTVALFGELDGGRVPGHLHANPKTGAAHACGHNAQIGMALGACVGLQAPGVLEALSGNVALCILPAEELIEVEHRMALKDEGKLEFFSGKQEFIRLGALDDVDMVMMAHVRGSAEGAFLLGGSSNCHVAKQVEFYGRQAHAAGNPHQGINALSAASVAQHAMHAIRETFKDGDITRIHWIVTRGGDELNAIPPQVNMEVRVRGRTPEIVAEWDRKVNRCLRAGALAVGGKVRIRTFPGYLPLINNPDLLSLFRSNAERFVAPGETVTYPSDYVRGGSEDLGDVSYIKPCIHPYTRGAVGWNHSDDFDIVDYDQAVVTPAKVFAMTVIDLLADGAAGAREVLGRFQPKMTKEQYLAFQRAQAMDRVFDEASGE
ncbi:MAG: amidohydrolase [Chloroflexi bacterium]|nr:amidohydrolase [Chloroflexota bacterium]